MNNILVESIFKRLLKESGLEVNDACISRLINNAAEDIFKRIKSYRSFLENLETHTIEAINKEFEEAKKYFILDGEYEIEGISFFLEFYFAKSSELGGSCSKTWNGFDIVINYSVPEVYGNNIIEFFLDITDDMNLNRFILDFKKNAFTTLTHEFTHGKEIELYPKEKDRKRNFYDVSSFTSDLEFDENESEEEIIKKQEEYYKLRAKQFSRYLNTPIEVKAVLNQIYYEILVLIKNSAKYRLTKLENKSWNDSMKEYSVEDVDSILEELPESELVAMRTNIKSRLIKIIKSRKAWKKSIKTSKNYKKYTIYSRENQRYIISTIYSRLLKKGYIN